MSCRFLLAAAGCAALAACSGGSPAPVDAPDGAPPRDGGAPDAGLPPEGLEIGCVCGPPDPYLTAERFAEAREAGCTILAPPCEGSVTVELNRRALDLAAAAGLGAIVADDRMPAALTGVTDATTRLDAIVADYGAHPGLAGYLVAVEPGVAAFPGHGEVVAYLRARDPVHPAWVTLAPSYAGAAVLGVSTFDEYVRQALDVVRPELLLTVHLPFLETGERPGFVADLGLVRRLTAERGVPFGQVVLASGHPGSRSPTEGEKRWEAMQTLAHGARALFFYAYWTPPDASAPPALVDRSGMRTSHYVDVKDLSADLQAMGRWLGEAKATGTFQEGPLPPGGTLRPVRAPVLVPGPAPVTVGLFNEPGVSFAVVANGDPLSPLSADVYVAAGGRAIERLDRVSGAWVDLAGSPQTDGTSRVRLELAAGDAELLRVEGGFAASGPAGPEALFGATRGGAGTLYRVDRTHGVSAVSAAPIDTCADGYTLVGHDAGVNGFWLCARAELASRTFWVGNVVGGGVSYYRMQGPSFTAFGAVEVGTCQGGSALLGQLADPSGFWVCME